MKTPREERLEKALGDALWVIDQVKDGKTWGPSPGKGGWENGEGVEIWPEMDRREANAREALATPTAAGEAADAGMREAIQLALLEAADYHKRILGTGIVDPKAVDRVLTALTAAKAPAPAPDGVREADKEWTKRINEILKLSHGGRAHAAAMAATELRDAILAALATQPPAAVGACEECGLGRDAQVHMHVPGAHPFRPKEEVTAPTALDEVCEICGVDKAHHVEQSITRGTFHPFKAPTPDADLLERMKGAGDWMASRCTDPQAVDAWRQITDRQHKGA